MKIFKYLLLPLAVLFSFVIFTSAADFSLSSDRQVYQSGQKIILTIQDLPAVPPNSFGSNGSLFMMSDNYPRKIFDYFIQPDDDQNYWIKLVSPPGESGTTANLKSKNGSRIQVEVTINSEQAGLWRAYISTNESNGTVFSTDALSFTVTGSSGGDTTTKSDSGISNPLKDGPESIIDLFGIIANFIFNLGVPVAVFIIIYSGIMMLISGGKPAMYQKGINGLKYSMIGLAVLLIGKGFFSLIKTFLGGN